MSFKTGALETLRAVGINGMVSRSRWRRERVLIFGYHGVSLVDEHLADPALYVSPEHFRGRLQRLRDGGYTVLRLRDALQRLKANSLPPKSVVLTFDDGTRDFAEVVVPILEEFSAPATVYVTTYYCRHAFPVFDTALQYLLWRARHTDKDVAPAIGSARRLPVHTEVDRQAAWDAVFQHAEHLGANAIERNDLLRRVAQLVSVDFDEFVGTGAFQQMTPDQVRALPADLIDVQLHTHRHRTPRVQSEFEREIADNRSYLTQYDGRAQHDHFCYPEGDYCGEFVLWLREMGVASAVTCIGGLASRSDSSLLLPRFLDAQNVPVAVFDAWTSGVASFLPRRSAHRLDPLRLGAVAGADLVLGGANAFSATV